MGQAVFPLMLAATAVGTGAQIYGTLQAGAAQQGAYEAEARSRALEAKQADLQAKQISALRMQELNANLGAIEAMRAGKNVLGDSPTGAAIIRSFTKESLGARANEVLDARLRALSARNAMWAAQQSGRDARRASYIAAIGAGADGLSSMASLLRPRPRKAN